MPWDSTKKNAGFSTSDDPYLPVPESHYDLAFDRQMTDPNSMLHHTRNAIHWRKHQPALVKGTAEAREKNGLAKIFRRAVKQKLLCLFNYGSYKQSFRPSDELSPQEIREFKLRPDEEIIVEPGQPKFYGGMPYVLK